jgi:3-deoxy-7-phosphoheptulonate synthase
MFFLTLLHLPSHAVISWGAIGARTTESQLHRELASGVSFPIGFKNGTDGRYGTIWHVLMRKITNGLGSVTVAIDAMRSASNPHAFMGVTEQGLAAIVKTRGNQDVHVILRGGTKGPNFASEHVRAASKSIEKARPTNHASIMIDCSRKHKSSAMVSEETHLTVSSDGNSQKNHNNQPKVVDDICSQLAAGDRNVTGVMIESHINSGRQDVPAEGPSGLKYGVSITDACVDWECTVGMLDRLNAAVKARRDYLFEQGLQRPAGFQRGTPPSP